MTALMPRELDPRGHAPRRPRRPRTPAATPRAPVPSDPTLPVADRRARARRSSRSPRSASLHWMVAARAGRARPRAGRARRGHRSRSRAMLGAGAAADGRARAGRRGRRRSSRAARARAARRAASPTSCCGPTRWGELASGISRGIAGAAGRARALPRPRRLDAHRDPARRHGARHARRRCSRSGRGARASASRRSALLACCVALYASRPSRSTSSASSCAARRCAARARVPAPGEAAGRRRRHRRARAPSAWRVLALMRRAGAQPRPRRGSTTRAGRSTPPRRKSTSFSWDHDYGPLNWPRDGRELLRVRAESARRTGRPRTSTAFDGVRWRAGRRRLRRPASTPDAEDMLQHRTQRDPRHDPQPLSTSSSPPATPTTSTRPTIRESPRGDGTWTASRHAAARRRLHARSSTRRSPTSAAPRRRAGGRPRRPGALPAPVAGGRPAPTIGQSGAPLYTFDFPPFGDKFTPLAARIEGNPHSASIRSPAVLRQGPYRRTWALAQRLTAEPRRRRTTSRPCSPTCATGFTYSETPPRSAATLDGFLFDAKSGYCQQYSGAMALLLRMAGDPGARRRPASRPARPTPRRGEYVVRDFDAHSWVEVYYPGFGWVTFDPTPAAAPPRSQPNEAGASGAPVGSAGAAEPRRRPAVRPWPARAAVPSRAPGGAGPCCRRVAVLLLAGAAVGCCAGAAAARHAAARVALASSSARCAARAAHPARARRCTRSSCASPARPPPPATCARVRELRYRDGRAARPARSAAGCGPSSDAAAASLGAPARLVGAAPAPHRITARR